MPTQYANVYRNLIAHYIGLSTNVVHEIKQFSDFLSPTISGCLHEEIVKLGKCICLIAHYIGLSTIYMRLNQGRLKVLSPTILGCLHMQHRELLVSLLLLSPTISGCLHIDGPYTQKRGDLIAHYIGLSTELVLKEKQENKHLSPTISGCLRLGWRVNDNG